MDKQIILKRIAFIKVKLEDLKNALDSYEKTKDVKEKKNAEGAIERWSEEIVESAVNINMELLAEINEITNSYYNSFINLEKLNFKVEFLKKIAPTAGFRNRLAHDYMDLDKELMIKTAKFILIIYKEYLLKVKKYLDESEKNSKKINSK